MNSQHDVVMAGTKFNKAERTLLAKMCVFVKMVKKVIYSYIMQTIIMQIIPLSPDVIIIATDWSK